MQQTSTYQIINLKYSYLLLTKEKIVLNHKIKGRSKSTRSFL